MADFCTICFANLFGSLDSEILTEDNLESLILSSILRTKPDIDIEDGYNEWIKPEINKYKSEPSMFLSFGICEGCGAFGMCVESENDITYLSLIRLVDFENKKLENHKIATINSESELKWYYDGIKQLLIDELH
jgi:hypothetical protein